MTVQIIAARPAVIGAALRQVTWTMGFGGDQHQFCRHVHQRIRRSGDWILPVNNWRIASDADRRADNRSAESPAARHQVGLPRRACPGSRPALRRADALDPSGVRVD